MKKSYFGAVCISASAFLLIYSSTAVGYKFYSDDTNDVGQCGACHTGFRDNNNYFSNAENAFWGESLHDAHLDNTDVDSSCDNCHGGADITTQRMVNLSSSGNAKDGVNAIACMGCHGRLEDGPGQIGDGLRAHHMGADGYLNWPGGIPGGLTCAQCHGTDTTPASESTAPPWYASVTNTSINMTMDPCSADGEEDFSSNGEGLDNDGDGAYDTLDGDCSLAVPTPGDFDFDGMADIMWRNATSGQVYFWQMNGPEITSSASVATPSTPNWEIVGTGDYNGDNKADIMWRNSVSRQVYYWQMDGSTITSSSRVATPSSDNWQVIGSGDYDGDGNDDIMWRHIGVGGSGEIYFWKMNGSMIMSSASVSFLTDLNWKAVGSGDYDGDTRSDLMWRHDLTGQVYYWRMNGSTILSSDAVATPADLKWRVVGNADYDGDGSDDLMWRNIGVGGTGKVYYWRMDGSTILSSARVSIVSDLDWSVVGDGDYDGDGNGDMLWLHGTNGQIYYWQQDGFTTLDPSPVSTLSDLDWEVVYTR
jgi:hypothetical protein